MSTPARVATYAYVNPVVAVFLGWALLGEPVSWGTVLAAAVIVSGVALITFNQIKPGLPGQTLAPERQMEREAIDLA